MKQLLLAPFLLGFISPVFADSWKDIEDLTKLIESNGTKIKERKNCKKNNLGHYSFKNKSNDVLTICLNNISEEDPSDYWEVLAHEAAHAMQECNNNTLWKSKYHPRMLRGLKSEAPHYAEILKQYRGRDKIFELEAFDMELQTPSEVKYNYEYYCLNNQNGESVENPVLTDENISLLHELVGGEDSYDQLLTWGRRNYSEDEIKKFDEIIDNGSFEDLKKSILNLYKKYIESNSEVKDLSAENNQEGLTEDEVKILKNLVGGENSYDKFVDWAINNLNEKEQLEYDQLVDSGDFEKVKSKMLYYFSKFEDSQNQNILTSKQIEDLQDSVGGSKKYDELMAWSRENLSVDEVTNFDEIILRQDYQEINETLSKLKNKYEESFLPKDKIYLSQWGGEFYKERKLSKKYMQILDSALNDYRQNNFISGIEKIDKLIEIDPSIPQNYYLKALGNYLRFKSFIKPSPGENDTEFLLRYPFPEDEIKRLNDSFKIYEKSIRLSFEVLNNNSEFKKVFYDLISMNYYMRSLHGSFIGINRGVLGTKKYSNIDSIFIKKLIKDVDNAIYYGLEPSVQKKAFHFRSLLESNLVVNRENSRNTSSMYMCGDALIASYYGVKDAERFLDSCNEHGALKNKKPFFIQCFVFPFSNPEKPQNVGEYARTLNYFGNKENNIFYIQPKENNVYALSNNINNSDNLYPIEVDSKFENRFLTFSKKSSKYFIDFNTGSFKEIYEISSDDSKYTKHSPGYCKKIKKPINAQIDSITKPWWQISG